MPNEAPLADFLSEWEANIRPSPCVRLPDAPYAQLSAVTVADSVRLASHNRLSFSSQGEHFAFAAAGRLWTVPSELKPALAKLQNSRDVGVSDLAAILSNPIAKNDLIKSLGVLARAGVVLVSKG